MFYWREGFPVDELAGFVAERVAPGYSGQGPFMVLLPVSSLLLCEAFLNKTQHRLQQAACRLNRCPFGFVSDVFYTELDTRGILERKTDAD